LGILTATKFFGEGRDADVISAIRHDAPIASARSAERLMVTMPFEKRKREKIADAIEKLRLQKSWSGTIYQARDKLDRVERDSEAIGFLSGMLRSGGGVASRIQIEGAVEFLSFYESRFGRMAKSSTEKELFMAIVKTGVWLLRIKSVLTAALGDKIDADRKQRLFEILEVTKGPLKRSMEYKFDSLGQDSTWKGSFTSSLEKIKAKLSGEIMEPFQDEEAETIFDVFYLVKLEIGSWEIDGREKPNAVKEVDIDRILALVYQTPCIPS